MHYFVCSPAQQPQQMIVVLRYSNNNYWCEISVNYHGATYMHTHINLESDLHRYSIMFLYF